METIKPTKLSEEKLDELRSYYGDVPKFTLYLIDNLLFLDKIDNQKLVNSIKKHIMKKLENDETVDKILKETSGYYYKYNRKIYLFCKNLDDDLFYHEVAHAVFTEKIKEIVKKKHKRLKEKEFIFLDEVNAEYWATIKSKSKNRMRNSSFYFLRNKRKFYENIAYTYGCFIALKELGVQNLSGISLEFDNKAFLLKKCFIYDDMELKDIDIDLFRKIILNKKR